VTSGSSSAGLQACPEERPSVLSARRHEGLHYIWVASILVWTLGAGACRPSAADKRLEPVYDKTTGRLQTLKYDSDGDGKIDTVSYMDGAVVLRIEIDKDEDGKVDRWEYYGADQKLEKIGSSRANDGKEDAWLYVAPDGTMTRLETSTRRNGKADRIEHYDKNRLARAEEDTDGDGTIDKWETYDDERLASVAFDTRHRGTPDRRLIYGPDGSARLEADAAGDGHFTAVQAQGEPKARARSTRP
jgi:hypothetical protein